MKKRTFTKEFKEEAVRLVHAEGLGIGATAKDLGISESALRKWVDAYQNKGTAAFPGSGNLGSNEQKIRELEKKLRQVEMERDI